MKSHLFPNGSEIKFEYKVDAPGRVNIIGEHVDYAGFPVLPMALEQTTTIYFTHRRNSETNSNLKLFLANSNEKYRFHETDLTKLVNNVKVFDAPIQWHHYVLSGVIGVLEHESEKSPCKLFSNVLQNGEIYAYVSGNVPPAAGLSSSSSLVVASAMMANIVKHSETGPMIKQETLADICAKSEKYVGTVGGGMDQAISILGVKNSASLISFFPKLMSKNVPLPENAAIVVAHTGVEMNKAATTDFNERVLSTQYAAAILSDGTFYKLKKLCVAFDWSLGRCLDEIENQIDDSEYKLVDLVESYGKLPRVEILMEKYGENAVLKLKNRARHVIEESIRVEEFQKICAGSCDLTKLGVLMSGSQKSLKELYEASCDELDNMCADMVRLGAFGARLTGAGWGGCAICLVEKSSLQGFLEELKRVYPQNLVFGTSASEGARFVML